MSIIGAKAMIDLTQFEGMTEGPWRYIKNRDGSINVLSPYDDEGCYFKIALINNRHEANARAIAALPDIIAELKRTRAALEIAKTEICRIKISEEHRVEILYVINEAMEQKP